MSKSLRAKEECEQCLRGAEGRAAPSDPDRFAIVDGLELCELLCVALDEVCELVEEAGPFEASDVLAPRGRKGLAGSADGEVDVSGRA